MRSNTAASVDIPSNRFISTLLLRLASPPTALFYPIAAAGIPANCFISTTIQSGKAALSSCIRKVVRGIPITVLVAGYQNRIYLKPVCSASSKFI